MKRVLAVLFVLVLLITGMVSASADRIPQEHNKRYIGAMRVVKCKEYVTLREEPYKWARALARVPLDAIVYNCSTIRQKTSFVYCEYEGTPGYILVRYLEKAPEYEPAVTSAITQKMTMEDVVGSGEVILDWQDFNISVLAAHEFVQEDKVKREILRVGCFIDGEPLWGHIETLDVYSELPMLKAFIGGTEDDPMVMLYDGGYGLTMIDLLSGKDVWTIMAGSCNLGDAAVIAVDEDEGSMYIAGTDGPDPVAISQEGRVIWKSEVEDEAVKTPYEMELKNGNLQVKYKGDLTEGYYLVSIDFLGDVTDIQAISE